MRNKNSEELFALVKGMTKCEKKNFHLYARRNVNNDKLKVLAVYNAMNSLEEYDQQKLLSRLKTIRVTQIPALKMNLHNLLLDSLCILHKTENVQLRLHQLMDHAKILYDRGMPLPALKTLKKVKALAIGYYQISFAFQAVVMEKKIELIHGSCAEEKITALNEEMNMYSEQLSVLGKLSNTSLIIYGWYKRFGTVKNKEDENKIDKQFKTIPAIGHLPFCFYLSLYLVQAKTYYHLIKNDSSNFLKAAKEWSDLFNAHSQMKLVEPVQYFRGLAYLSEAALLAGEAKTLHHCFEKIKTSTDIFYYLLISFNVCICEKRFNEQLLDMAAQMILSKNNSERMLMISYKASLLCMSSGKYERAIDFTHLASTIKTEARIDIQYELKLIHIEAHKQIGNVDIIDYLKASADRFTRLNKLVS